MLYLFFVFKSYFLGYWNWKLNINIKSTNFYSDKSHEKLKMNIKYTHFLLKPNRPQIWVFCHFYFFFAWEVKFIEIKEKVHRLNRVITTKHWNQTTNYNHETNYSTKTDWTSNYKQLSIRKTIGDNLFVILTFNLHPNV